MGRVRFDGRCVRVRLPDWRGAPGETRGLCANGGSWARGIEELGTGGRKLGRQENTMTIAGRGVGSGTHIIASKSPWDVPPMRPNIVSLNPFPCRETSVVRFDLSPGKREGEMVMKPMKSQH